MTNEQMDLIDRQALLKEVTEKYHDKTTGSYPFNIFAYDMAQIVIAAPVVDAVEVADMREFAEEVVYQYGYYGQYEGRLHIAHGGLSTLEHAFDILGWDNPHPVPECECEIEGCHEHATCGAPTSNGYKRMCGRHYRERSEGE